MVVTHTTLINSFCLRRLENFISVKWLFFFLYSVLANLVCFVETNGDLKEEKRFKHVFEQ